MARDFSRVGIRLVVEALGEAEGEMIRYLAPRTVDALSRNLPLEGRAALWKNAVHFEVSIRMGSEKPKNMAAKGALAYWPMGRAFCIFYDETRPHGQVNIIGQVTKNLEMFRQIKSGAKIVVSRI